ncbi:hypothetical protein [Marinomonas posidonica]|uniref:Flagellar protein FliT n=1 Tax=Marinomonas posidonica (strain CECT 7376 / NCIMB 14433 / IVIA-Po-181) TaxID=491952 RepID=F6CZK2_MARPP|nr:hypothetical protein [Marinomonas posidonica]AEF55814.1 hypothetical protein Mar181_2783 [Marinomonas posidonica IVIA-Po-181]
MHDIGRLSKLVDDLQQAVLSKDIEEILHLCSEYNDFIYSLVPEKKHALFSEKVKALIVIHQSAVQLVKESHLEMQDQLYQSIKVRKSISKYKGIKHAE